VTTLRVFWLHLSILLPCEWWGRRFLNHLNIEAVPNKWQSRDSPRKTKQYEAVLQFLMITLIQTCLLAYVREKLEIILWLIFDIQPLVVYKGGRPHNSILEHFLYVTVGNKKHAKCKKCCPQQGNNVTRMQVHYTKCLTYSVSSASNEWIFSTLEIFTLKSIILSATAKLLSWYSSIGFSEAVLN